MILRNSGYFSFVPETLRLFHVRAARGGPGGAQGGQLNPSNYLWNLCIIIYLTCCRAMHIPQQPT